MCGERSLEPPVLNTCPTSESLEHRVLNITPSTPSDYLSHLHHHHYPHHYDVRPTFFIPFTLAESSQSCNDSKRAGVSANGIS